jgi:hypothetical protein
MCVVDFPAEYSLHDFETDPLPKRALTAEAGNLFG